MRETDFVKQNKQNWTAFEKELVNAEPRPEKITKHYVEIVDDLSYARTFYGTRLVRSYLNGAAENLSIKIHRSRRQNWVHFKKFWRIDLPLIMFESRFQFLLAFLIFALAVAIGILSSMYDKNFAQAILGQGYINQTLKNIKNGDPMAIYKSSEALPMFFHITWNNTLIAAKTFIMSLFFGFGTVIVLVYNGVMVGVFQYFFIERGLFFESFLTIWQHGVVEISCIILAGAAGLVLAKGMIFPGTYSRIDAFRLSGRKGLIMMLGILPLLIYSGIIESWVTRLTDVHWAFRLSTILLSVTFVLVYFYFYPRRVSKKAELNDVFKVVKIPLETSSFDLTGIQRTLSIWWESLRIFTQKAGLIFLIYGALAFVFYVANFFIIPEKEVAGGIWFLTNSSSLFIHSALFFGAFVALWLGAILVAKKFPSSELGNDKFRFHMRVILLSIFFAGFSSFMFSKGWLFFLWLFTLPILGEIYSNVIHFKQDSGNSVLSATKTHLGISYFRHLGLLLLSLVAIFLVYMLLNWIQTTFLISFFSDLLLGNMDQLQEYLNLIGLFSGIFFIFGFFITVFMSFALSHATVHEISTAEALKNKIEKLFPQKNRTKTEKVELLRKEVFQS